MRIQVVKSLMAALAMLMFIGCSKDANTVSFTADMVQQVNNRRIEGKIFVKGNEYRMDIKEEGKEISILVNRESGKQKVLIHSQKVAREYLNTSSISLSNNPFEYFNSLLEQYSSSKKGSEVINGYECKKIEVYKGDKKLSTAWISKELNWPIKIETAVNPIKDVDLNNIKEEPVKANLFEVPKDYKIYPLFAGDVGKMKETVLKKLEEKKIERETEDGIIRVRGFGGTVLTRHFPGWKFFHVVREKETGGSIQVLNAVVSNDIKTVYLLDRPKSDMPIDVGLKIFRNQNIKLNGEKDVKEFGQALALLYFIGAKIEGVESLGENKWAVYLGTISGDLNGFIVKVNNNGEITELDYKLQIK